MQYMLLFVDDDDDDDDDEEEDEDDDHDDEDLVVMIVPPSGLDHCTYTPCIRWFPTQNNDVQTSLICLWGSA